MRYGILALCVIATAACKQKTGESKLDSLAFNPDARNIAVVFGSPRDLPGIDIDVNEAENLLKANPYRFEVRPKFKATKGDITSMARQAAAEVSADGTLAVVFSGHGARTGEWAAEDAMVRFGEVADQIRAGRPNLKRLLVIVDACFSGQLADGQNGSILLTENDGNYDEELNTLVDVVIQEAGGASLRQRPDFNLQDDKNPGLADQTFVIASSTREQTSGATRRGSVFLMSIIGQLKNASETTTFRQVADATVADVNRSDKQRPVYRAAPTSLLEEPVKGRTQPGVGPTPPPNGPQPPQGPAEQLGMPEDAGPATALPPGPQTVANPQAPPPQAPSTSSPSVAPRPQAPSVAPSTGPRPVNGSACVCRQVGSECQLVKGDQVLSRSPESDPNACARWACNPTGGRFRDLLNSAQCR